MFVRNLIILLEHGSKRMLILTRRVGETLMIGDEVTVTVLGVKGNHIYPYGGEKDFSTYLQTCC